MKFKSAFTLSEVMLVLAVIGVISALVLPGLIQSTQNKQLVTKLKKEYSVISQAYTSIVADNDGSITNDSSFSTSTASTGIINEFAGKLNIIKNCGMDSGCLYTTPLKFLGGTVNYPDLEAAFADYFGKAVLADGASIAVRTYGNNCSLSKGSAGTPLDAAVCGEMHVDVNGAAGPNAIGKDFFTFWITKTGIYPLGAFDDGCTCVQTSAEWESSQGCTAKILQEGAMNY